MGFLDKAKKLAEQARDAAEQAKKLAEMAANKAGERLADATKDSSTPQGGPVAPPGGTGGAPAPQWSSAPAGAPPAPKGPVEYGTPYVPGMLKRPGWRERGFTDPAALLPIRDRDRVGVAHSTKSQILEEPFGMGRRWSSGGRATGLYYQLYPEHEAWEPPGGKVAWSGAPGATRAALADGRTLIFLRRSAQSVVLEISGLDDPAQTDLARVVSEQLPWP